MLLSQSQNFPAENETYAHYRRSILKFRTEAKEAVRSRRRGTPLSPGGVYKAETALSHPAVWVYMTRIYSPHRHAGFRTTTLTTGGCYEDPPTPLTLLLPSFLTPHAGICGDRAALPSRLPGRLSRSPCSPDGSGRQRASRLLGRRTQEQSSWVGPGTCLLPRLHS